MKTPESCVPIGEQTVFHYSKCSKIYKWDKEGSILRILLVQSPAGRREAPIYPLGLAYLAGGLRNHDCSGIDLSLEESPGPALHERIQNFKPDLVAVSLRNIDDSAYPHTFWYLDSFQDAMTVLEKWKGHLVAGGAGFSIYPDVILEKWPGISIGLVGEGELALPAIIEYLEGGNKPPWLQGKLARPPRPDLNTIPLPDYTVFPRSDYTGKASVGIQTRRGCVFNCAYCTYKSLSGCGFRLRPLEHVAADIRTVAELGFDSFMFVDSVFDHPKSYYLKLLDMMLEMDDLPYWEAWLSESVPLETLEKLYRAGCRWVDFSPDVITRKGWALMGKGGDVRRLWPAVKNARKAGLSVGVNFFSASPGENLYALLLKFFFMARARILLGFRSTFINIGTIRLYRGAPLAEELHRGEDLFEPVFYRPRGLADGITRGFQFVRKLRK